MTTMCLCDWVETQADREQRLAAVDAAQALAKGRPGVASSGSVECPADGRAAERGAPNTPNLEYVS